MFLPEDPNHHPLLWLENAAAILQWPVVAACSFFLGRYVSRLEMRVVKAEKNVQDIVERHFPHIHQALAEIKTALATIQGAILGGK